MIRAQSLAAKTRYHAHRIPLLDRNLMQPNPHHIHTNNFTKINFNIMVLTLGCQGIMWPPTQQLLIKSIKENNYFWLPCLNFEVLVHCYFL
jgi:hypothetical protein